VVQALVHPILSVIAVEGADLRLFTDVSVGLEMGRPLRITV
jgi:hypothetical protein